MSRSRRKQSFGLSTEDAMDADAINEYKGIFKAIDLNKNGSISKADLASSLAAYGIRMSPAQIEEMWNDTGLSDSSSLSFSQFVSMIEANMSGYVTKPMLGEAFECIEANVGRDELVGGGPGPNKVRGKLNADQFEKLLLTTGDKLRPDEVDAFFSFLKVSAGGELSTEELTTLLTQG
ncbi:uncharacterized protein AMSG_02831 [Thecamonas trahens ATCC 50062]|uniref:EF-hand domain-containing protein n=1 Tax=Thecamonas trahens ATCC 50062 TaxID=461836 RepID=A0A0L0D200_THETB|nr:hypothetical protein AMSG_02831 [Thecamonas trahens ATCC 50062]KNC46379.1 hypothetical protein AMSG_02831 [Thecamonas trahens ATCC 50062]|eukprot:XP_013760672.1 hypothetical protein AMSG_02831 [Thecamonas trahens ATCC 50062]